ncbi:MAG: methyltransferase domain-containing protein [Deltaproteobacteria bacterium]|nr:methyltransferase domain-containing protein [Deltaproteobacteria bacterium]
MTKQNDSKTKEIDKRIPEISHEGWGLVHGDYYAQLSNQQIMLEDTERTGMYHQSITLNMKDFMDKVVMDVGAGSGILSFFAAHAGARKVYAIEATEMANHAHTLVKANGLSGQIEVIQEKIEDLQLPEKVDIIVSEPMGIFLVHERMMEVYALARERWLKPDGKMFPSKGRIFLAPFTDNYLHSSHVTKTRFWENTEFYSIDVSSLAGTALSNYFSKPFVGPVDQNTLMAEPSSHEFNFLTVAPKDYAQFKIELNFTATSTGLMHGLAGWFDVHFEGTSYLGHLSTAPSSPATHWLQIRFLFEQPIAMNIGQKFSGTVSMTANNGRSYNMSLEGKLEDTDISIKQDFYLQNHQYWWHSSSKSEDAEPNPENYGLHTIPILQAKSRFSQK